MSPTLTPALTPARTPVFTPALTLATARRVLRQLRHDRRTVALLLVVPVLLMALLRWIFDGQPALFDRVAPPLLGIFPFVTMFLVTSVATLRERTSGTLERLLTLPIGKLDLVLGYALAFGVMAVLQAGVVTAVALTLLGLDVAGGAGPLLGVALLVALLGTALGLLVSAFASSEFQAVQFMPAVVLPQVLLCGLFIPVGSMDGVLQAAAEVLPMTYAVDAMTRVASGRGGLGPDVAVIAGCVLVALGLGAGTLRRSSA